MTNGVEPRRHRAMLFPKQNTLLRCEDDNCAHKNRKKMGFLCVGWGASDLS